jgi:hypothetical protein
MIVLVFFGDFLYLLTLQNKHIKIEQIVIWKVKKYFLKLLAIAPKSHKFRKKPKKNKYKKP